MITIEPACRQVPSPLPPYLRSSREKTARRRRNSGGRRSRQFFGLRSTRKSSFFSIRLSCISIWKNSSLHSLWRWSSGRTRNVWSPGPCRFVASYSRICSWITFSNRRLPRGGLSQLFVVFFLVVLFGIVVLLVG